MTAYARLPALRLRLVATHFGLSRHERCRQVAALRRIVAADRSAPLLLLGDFRSEEHTSELQSLMRISYAVFCLKNKNTVTTQQLLNHLSQSAQATIDCK